VSLIESISILEIELMLIMINVLIELY